MEPTEEVSTPDNIEQQCDTVDCAEPTSLVYAESVSNPQRGTYTYVGMYTYGHTFVSLDHSVQLQTFNSLQKDLPSFINTNNIDACDTHCS